MMLEERKLKKKSHGQALTEFALALPVLLTLVYGVLESGRLLFIYGSTVTAARQAVRYGSATGFNANGTPYYQDCEGIRGSAKSVGIINRFDDSDILVTYDEGLNADGTVNQISNPDPACGSYAAVKNGDRIKVSVSTQWSPIVPLVPFEPFEITSSSERTILLSIDLASESEVSTFDGTGAGCALLNSITASPDPYTTVGPVTYTYNLQNAGSETLVSPAIVDSKVSGITCPNSVDAAADYTCTGTYTITQADLEAGSVINTANPTVYCGTKNDNTKTLVITALQSPALGLSVVPSVEAISVPGTVIAYTYTLTNTGNVSLTGPFSVTDDRVSSINCSSATSPLAPGSATTCIGTYILTGADIIDRQIVNTAIARGQFNASTVTSNSANAIVYTPPIFLVVIPSTLSITESNQSITFTYNIKNITDVPIYSPHVEDDLLSVDCSSATNPLPVGASTKCTATYVVSQSIIDIGESIVNSATAYGIRESESVSSNTFTLNTPVTQNALLTAVLEASAAENPATPGTLITYTYHLTNSGNQTLSTPINIIDDKSAFTCSDQSDFLPGTSRTCTGTYTVTTDDMQTGSVINAGYATANIGPASFSSFVTALISDPSTTTTSTNGVQSNTVSATVPTFAGARFNIAVSADKTFVTQAGEVITYTYTFTNTGSTDLEQPFAITSSLGSSLPSSSLDCSTAVNPLPAGSNTTCKSTYTVSGLGTITNTVTDATVISSGQTISASNTPLASVSTAAYLCTSTNLKFTDSPTSGGSGNSTVTWTISNTVGTSLPISAVVISWAGSGNGNSDTHLNTVTVSGSTINVGTLPDKVSSYISGTGTLATGDTNITMDFSKKNPSGISVAVIFANPYSSCHLP